MKKHLKITSLVSLLFFLLAYLFIACNNNEEPNPPGNNGNESEGKVIIVGAGASGLAAAKKLEEKGISYQILEATDKVGGRIRKNENFADFPIDLGAEWIHADKSILRELLDQPGTEPEVETILYQPLDVYVLDGTDYYQYPVAELETFYENYIVEYKFKNTTWFDYINDNFADFVKENIVFNAKVNSIDYSGEKVVVTTDDGSEYIGDKVISTVSVGVLKSNFITFVPELPIEKTNAIESVELLPGFKLFLKFSEKFYPDVITVETPTGEKTIYDIAYHKEKEDHVLGLLSTGISAEQYYQLGSPQSIVDEVIEELDGILNGAASQYYTGEYIMKDWGQQVTTLGTWPSNEASSSSIQALNAPLQEKVFFAGVSFDDKELRGSVQSAIVSGYEVVDRILE